MEEKEAEANVRQGNQSFTASRSGPGRELESLFLFLLYCSLVLGRHSTGQISTRKDDGGGRVFHLFFSAVLT